MIAETTAKKSLENLLQGKLVKVEAFMDDTEDLVGDYCVALTLHYIDNDGSSYSVVIKPDVDEFGTPCLHVE